MPERDDGGMETECAECYHGVSLHTEPPVDACSVPGCDCGEFLDPDTLDD